MILQLKLISFFWKKELDKITTKQYEKSSEMYLKIISQSTPSTLQYILPVVGCVVARCSTFILAKSPANCGAHLAESLFQTLSGMYQKTFSQSAHLTLWYIFLNLAAIVRYGNLILILVKVPQIVTYIL